jgi:hypothetical protein
MCKAHRIIPVDRIMGSGGDFWHNGWCPYLLVVKVPIYMHTRTPVPNSQQKLNLGPCE